MKIVVIGGTGLIGSKTTVLLRAAGHDALAAAPNTGVNTVTGERCSMSLKDPHFSQASSSREVYSITFSNVRFVPHLLHTSSRIKSE